MTVSVETETKFPTIADIDNCIPPGRLPYITAKGALRAWEADKSKEGQEKIREAVAQLVVGHLEPPLREDLYEVLEAIFEHIQPENLSFGVEYPHERMERYRVASRVLELAVDWGTSGSSEE